MLTKAKALATETGRTVIVTTRDGYPAAVATRGLVRDFAFVTVDPMYPGLGDTAPLADDGEGEPIYIVNDHTGLRLVDTIASYSRPIMSICDAVAYMEEAYGPMAEWPEDPIVIAADDI